MVLLRSSPAFAGLTSTALAELAGAFHRQSVTAETEVVSAGADGDAVYVIAVGTFAVSAGGRRLVELGVGDHFGEVGWLYGTPRTASVLALTDGEVLRLPGGVLDEFLTHHPSARVAIASAASSRYVGVIGVVESDDEPRPT